LLVKNQILLNPMIMQMSYRFPAFLEDHNNSVISTGYTINPESIPPIHAVMLYNFYTLVSLFNTSNVLHDTCFFV
jgi:hypothetical protein